MIFFKSSPSSALTKLGPFSLTQAEEIGISHQELSRLVKEEKINRMEQGVYL